MNTEKTCGNCGWKIVEQGILRCGVGAIYNPIRKPPRYPSQPCGRWIPYLKGIINRGEAVRRLLSKLDGRKATIKHLLDSERAFKNGLNLYVEYMTQLLYQKQHNPKLEEVGTPPPIKKKLKDVAASFECKRQKEAEEAARIKRLLSEQKTDWYKITHDAIEAAGHALDEAIYEGFTGTKPAPRSPLSVRLWQYTGDNVFYAQIVEQDEALRNRTKNDIKFLCTDLDWQFYSWTSPTILSHPRTFYIRGCDTKKDKNIMNVEYETQQQAACGMRSLAAAVEAFGGVATVDVIDRDEEAPKKPHAGPEANVRRSWLYVKLWVYTEPHDTIIQKMPGIPGNAVLCAQIVEQWKWLRGTGNMGTYNGWLFVSEDGPGPTFCVSSGDINNIFYLRGNNLEEDHNMCRIYFIDKQDAVAMMHDLAKAVRLFGGFAETKVI